MDLTVPIQVNLPDDWVEQIVDRLKNDPEAEWVQVVRCKDCKHSSEWIDIDGTKGLQCDVTFDEFGYGAEVKSCHYCSYAERRTDD